MNFSETLTDIENVFVASSSEMLSQVHLTAQNLFSGIHFCSISIFSEWFGITSLIEYISECSLDIENLIVDSQAQMMFYLCNSSPILLRSPHSFAIFNLSKCFLFQRLFLALKIWIILTELKLKENSCFLTKSDLNGINKT